MNITIVEDDKKIREELAKLLKENGYLTTVIDDFEKITHFLASLETDLILLDVNLPFQNGYEICRELLKKKHVPIIFVTSRNTDTDELLSIQSGGIDFLSKPYNKHILLEKIHRALKQNRPEHFRYLTRNGITLDLHLSFLSFNDKSIELTRNEFRILYYFFIQEKRIITKEELLEYLWNDKCYLDEGILMVNINRLRTKAKEIGIKNLLKTIRKKGYTL